MTDSMMADAARILEEIRPELDRNAAEADPVVPSFTEEAFEAAEQAEPSADASAILERLAFLEQENAHLRTIAGQATEQATLALAMLNEQPQVDVLSELEALKADLRDEQIRELHREISAFRREVRRRSLPWWRKLFVR